MTIQDRIKSNNFAFWISFFAVIIQSIHTAYILTNLSSLGRLASIHSFAISILISGSILYFTLKGKTKIAIWAAILESYFNICYYILYISSSDMSWKYLFIAIPSSLALPTVLALFSHELVDNKEIIVDNKESLLDRIIDIENNLDNVESLKILFDAKVKAIKTEELLKGKSLKLDIETKEGFKTFNAKIK